MRKGLERRRSKSETKAVDSATFAKRRALARRAVETLTHSYFLRCLDALPAKKAKILSDEMTPLLQKIFNTKKAWHQILEEQLELKPGTPDNVRAIFAGQPAGTSKEDFVSKYAGAVLASKRL